MAEIYEQDKFYSTLRYLTDAHILMSFRKYRFVGMEKLPEDGPIIYAPNHCDALMDPLTVLAMNRDAKVFVARADVFENKYLHKLLTFFKMMPINRRRDGIRNMTKAGDTIEKSIEVLNHGVDFCILPEGTHRSMHSLLPIGKGIARIACGALESRTDDKPVYIVPVGIEYGDYYRFRTTMLAHIGDPINVEALLASRPGINEHDAMDLIRSEVAGALRKNIVYIEDNEDYDAVWALSKIDSGKVPCSKLIERFEANKSAVARIERFRRERYDAAQLLFDRVRAFERQRVSAKVSLGSLRSGSIGFKTMLCTLLSIVLLPVFLVAATVSLPIWLSAELAIRNMEDRTFRNSFRLAFIVFGWTLVDIVLAVVLFCTLPWLWALILFATTIPAPYAVYDYFELVRMTASHWRCLFNAGLRKEYHDIAEELKTL